jgi:hypothetical protein
LKRKRRRRKKKKSFFCPSRERRFVASGCKTIHGALNPHKFIYNVRSINNRIILDY